MPITKTRGWTPHQGHPAALNYFRGLLKCFFAKIDVLLSRCVGWSCVSSLSTLASNIQHVDLHIDAAIFLTVVAGLVVGIREVAADAQLTDRTQRNVVLHRKVMHDGIRALAAQVAIIGH